MSTPFQFQRRRVLISDQFPKHAQSSAPFFYTGYETFTSHFSTSLKDRGYRYGTRHAYGSALSCNLRWHTQESPRTQTINRVTEDAFLEHLPECGCSVQQESISQRYPPRNSGQIRHRSNLPLSLAFFSFKGRNA